MNQGKLEVVNQEMARVNVDILGICKLKWTGVGELTMAELRPVRHQSGLTHSGSLIVQGH